VRQLVRWAETNREAGECGDYADYLGILQHVAPRTTRSGLLWLPLCAASRRHRGGSDGRLTFLVQQREFVREGGSHREHVLYRLRRVSESARTSRPPSDRISNAA
jgi:hypothetical protein